MLDADRLRRAVLLRGRVSEVREMTSRHRQMNPRLTERVLSGQVLSGEELADEDDNPVFVFGFAPCEDPWVVR